MAAVSHAPASLTVLEPRPSSLGAVACTCRQPVSHACSGADPGSSTTSR